MPQYFYISNQSLSLQGQKNQRTYIERGEYVELNRCAYVILGILRTKNATDKVHGLTIAEISALERVSKPNTIHKRIKEMKENGFVDDGVKAGKAKTYYLTEKGLNILPEKREEKKIV